MSRQSQIREILKEKGIVHIPIPEFEEGMSWRERHKVKQRLRSAIREAAWRLGLIVVLKTTDTEVIGTVVTERPTPEERDEGIY